MTQEYLKPMLDVGSPRVLNCNVITKRILAEDPEAKTFFRCRPLNNMVLVKDTDMLSHTASIGTKLYLPFNENDIYEGGRTIFVHDASVEKALLDIFGSGALPSDALSEDMHVLEILDRLPSLDPFLLKDVFINEKIEMNSVYFEVDAALWDQIELYILQGFEPIAKAAFPDAVSSDKVARKLIEKIWEGRDLDALRPLVMAFHLPAGQELEIFAAWKGVMFYGFEHQRALPDVANLRNWLHEVKIPLAAVSSTAEREELKATIETIKMRMAAEWRSAEQVLLEYKTSYEKMFKLQTGSADFLKFLQNSKSHYWTLGNSLGKLGHAVYCWDCMSKRFPERKMPWDKLFEMIILMSKIFTADKKVTTAAKW